MKALSILSNRTTIPISDCRMSPPPEHNLNLLDSLPALIWASGRDARCNQFNKAWLEFTGRSFEDELGDGWTAGVHRGDLNDRLKTYLTAFRAREPFNTEFRLRRHDGSYRWIAEEARPFDDAKGEFAGFLGHCIDVTDRKLSDEALKDDERCLRMLTKSSPVAIFRTDTEGNCEFVNERWTRITGLSPNDSMGPHWFRAIHPDDQVRIEKLLTDSFRSREEINLECRLLTESGEFIRSILQTTPELDEQGVLRGCMGTITELTKGNLHTDEELKRMKIASLEGLAEQIAHQFNNILTPIVLNLNIAQNQLRQPGLHLELANRLKEAEIAAQRAKALTHELLSFGSATNPLKKTVSLKDLIEKTVRFPTNGGHSSVYLSLQEDLWPASIDTRQFNHVIMILVANAVEAMPDGGVVRLSAANIAQEDLPANCDADGNYVRIQVQDDGFGIKPENLHKVFEPYYSTKSQRSGLGLATAHSIVTKHSGHILIDSTPGSGTTVSLYFPAAETAVLNRTAAPKAVAAPDRCRILIMDDEELVRSSVRAILTTLGYQVETARDGNEALEAFTRARDEGEPIDVTIMDITIQGGMGGKEAIVELKALDPEAKAVVCSGHSNDPIMVNFREYGFSAAIQKPFHPDELSSLLAEFICD